MMGAPVPKSTWGLVGADNEPWVQGVGADLQPPNQELPNKPNRGMPPDCGRLPDESGQQFQRGTIRGIPEFEQFVLQNLRCQRRAGIPLILPVWNSASVASSWRCLLPPEASGLRNRTADPSRAWLGDPSGKMSEVQFSLGSVWCRACSSLSTRDRGHPSVASDLRKRHAEHHWLMRASRWRQPVDNGNVGEPLKMRPSMVQWLD